MFAKAMQPKAWLYSAFIYNLAGLEDYDAVFDMVKLKISHGHDPSPRMWFYLLDRASQALHKPLTTFIWNRQVAGGFLNPPSGVCSNVLLTAARAGDIILARAVIKHLHQRSTRASLNDYEMLIDTYLAAKDMDGALRTLCIMQDLGFGPRIDLNMLQPLAYYMRVNKIDYSALWTRLASWRRENTTSAPMGLVNLLIQFAAGEGDLNRYKRYPSLTSQRANDETFNILLQACEQHNNVATLRFVVNEMRAFDMKPTPQMYCKIVNTLLNTGHYSVAEEFIEKIEARFENGLLAIPLNARIKWRIIFEKASTEDERLKTTFAKLWESIGAGTAPADTKSGNLEEDIGSTPAPSLTITEQDQQLWDDLLAGNIRKQERQESFPFDMRKVELDLSSLGIGEASFQGERDEDTRTQVQSGSEGTEWHSLSKDVDSPASKPRQEAVRTVRSTTPKFEVQSDMDDMADNTTSILDYIDHGNPWRTSSEADVNSWPRFSKEPFDSPFVSFHEGDPPPTLPPIVLRENGKHPEEPAIIHNLEKSGRYRLRCHFVKPRIRLTYQYARFRSIKVSSYVPRSSHILRLQQARSGMKKGALGPRGAVRRKRNLFRKDLQSTSLQAPTITHSLNHQHQAPRGIRPAPPETESRSKQAPIAAKCQVSPPQPELRISMYKSENKIPPPRQPLSAPSTTKPLSDRPLKIIKRHTTPITPPSPEPRLRISMYESGSLPPAPSPAPTEPKLPSNRRRRIVKHHGSTPESGTRLNKHETKHPTSPSSPASPKLGPRSRRRLRITKGHLRPLKSKLQGLRLSKYESEHSPPPPPPASSKRRSRPKTPLRIVKHASADAPMPGARKGDEPSSKD